MLVVGVDGCKGGWVLVALDRGAFAGAARFTNIEQLVQAVPDARAIGVDMPIGLLASGRRACDGLVRTFVEARRNSVFATPPREAIEAPDFRTANRLSRRLAKRGLTKQAYNLRDKILEVDDWVHNHTAPSSLPGGRIVEVHPEASFRQMRGASLEYAKKTYNGAAERLALLRRNGIALPERIEALGNAGFDDVVDAAAAAWTAMRYAKGQAECLPPRVGWQHDRERVITIWI